MAGAEWVRGNVVEDEGTGWLKGSGHGSEGQSKDFDSHSGSIRGHRKIFSKEVTWSDLYLMSWMLCWEKTVGGLGWKQEDQSESDFNNPGYRWWWLGSRGTSGDSEKWLDSNSILKVEPTGFSKDQKCNMRETNNNDPKVFCLSK